MVDLFITNTEEKKNAVRGVMLKIIREKYIETHALISFLCTPLKPKANPQ